LSTNGFPTWVSALDEGMMGIETPFDRVVISAYSMDEDLIVWAAPLPPGNFDFFAKLVPARPKHKSWSYKARSWVPWNAGFPVNANWTNELQKLIARQYGLQGRHEKRNRDVLVLQPAKGGVKGFGLPAAFGSAVAPRPKQAPGLPSGYFHYTRMPVSALVSRLKSDFKMPVVDQTGLVGKFDYALEWDNSGPSEQKLERLKQALTDQLGLELVATNIPVDTLIVEKTK
jgi:uncharacterized protein (TIGR03435 family)